MISFTTAEVKVSHKGLFSQDTFVFAEKALFTHVWFPHHRTDVQVPSHYTVLP